MKKYEKYVLNLFPIKNFGQQYSKSGKIINFPKYQYPYLKILKKISNFSIIYDYKNLLIARNESELVYNLLLINLCKEKKVMMYPLNKIGNISNINIHVKQQNIIFLESAFDKCLDIFVLEEILSIKKIFNKFFSTETYYMSVIYYIFLKEQSLLKKKNKLAIQIFIFYSTYIGLFKEYIEKKYNINYNNITSFTEFYQVSKHTDLMNDYFKKFIPVLEKNIIEIQSEINKHNTPELVNKIKSKIIPMVAIKDVKSLIDDLNPAWNKKEIEKIYCEYVEK